jgi:hypothetical protein
MKKTIILLISIILFSCSKTTTEPETEQPQEEIKTYKLSNLTSFGYITIKTTELGEFNLLPNETKIIQLKSLTILNKTSSMGGVITTRQQDNNYSFRVAFSVYVTYSNSSQTGVIPLKYYFHDVLYEKTITVQNNYFYITNFDEDVLTVYNTTKQAISLQVKGLTVEYIIKSASEKIVLDVKNIK